MILVAAAAFWAAPCFGEAQGQTTKLSTLGFASINDLLGKYVTDRQGTRLAHVGGVLLESDRIAYLILYIPEPGGSWRQVPVPATLVELNNTTNAVVVDLEQRVLSNAPSYTGSEYPDFSDLEWEQQIHTYYGERPPDRAIESYILIRR